MTENLKKSRIRVQNISSDETTEHHAEFTDSEWRQLQDYVEYAADLRSTQFVRNGGAVKISFHWADGSTAESAALAPPPDDVLAFLHRLRPLILQDETTSFPKIRAILTRRFSDPSIRLLMSSLLDQYEGKQLQAVIGMDSNGVRMNCEKMLLTWLNAHEYHRDRDKQAIIKSHTNILPAEWWRGVFLLLLNEKAKAIFDLGVIVETALGKRKLFSARF